MLMRKLIKNRKGTAEVIGTIMFIVILLFFFTNVYLWHDAAVKDSNQLYMKKIVSTFGIEQINGTRNIAITADGGSDIVLHRLWIVEGGSNGKHLYADLSNVRVVAGKSFYITLASYTSPSSPIDHVNADSPGSSNIVVYYTPTTSVTCTVVNTLGVVESTTFTP